MLTWEPEDRRRNLARYLAKCNGNVVKTAYRLGIHRSHMYRLIEDHELWPVVNEARRRKQEVDHAERNKKYRGDGLYL